MIPEISPARLALMVVATVILLIAAAIFCSGCTTAQLASYEKGVDSRSIEGYAKEGSSGGQQGGIKYTVHYR